MLDENLCSPNSHLIQEAHGNGQRQLRHHIGWRHDGRNDKRQDHKVTSEVFQLFNADHAQTSQDHDGDGHFEGQTKGQEHVEHKAQIGLDVWSGRDAFGCEALNEFEDLSKHKEITKRNANEKQDRA